MSDTPETTPETPQDAPTVRVKPIVIPGAPTPTVRLKPVIPGVTPIKPAAPATAPAASITPTAAAPVDPSVQAAKGKTSRISLDAAILTPPETAGPKTIRLKRPMDAPVGKLTSHLPATEGDAPAAGADAEGTPTQRKTIRVKKPGVALKTTLDGFEVAGTAAEETTDDTPAITLESDSVAEKVNVLFPILAAASIVVMLALIGILATPAGNPLFSF